jgi:glycerol uptake facilitator-like aquaporin
VPVREVPLARRFLAEFLATGFLLAVVVGSGIMGERLSGGNVAIALLANSLATGAALAALILAFGEISGAHLNPVVTACDALEGGIPWKHVGPYSLAQLLGAFAGVGVADAMFGVPVFTPSRHARAGGTQLLSEFVATFGLLAVIWGCSRRKPAATAFAVGGWIAAAYWFTSSTSFANPAVTLARCMTDTFAGIRPVDVAGFVVVQILGGVSATLVFRWLVPALPALASNVVAGER